MAALTPKRLSAASWGDLLLFQALPQAQADLARARQLLGLPEFALPSLDEPPEPRKPPQPPPEPQPPQPPLPPAAKPALQCRQMLYVEKEPADSQNLVPIALPRWGAEESLEVEHMLDAPPGLTPPRCDSLLDQAQFLKRWRRFAVVTEGQRLDLDRMLHALARAQWPVPLPHKGRVQRLTSLQVCIDWHPDRHFLYDDYQDLLALLQRSQPRLRLEVHGVETAQDWDRLLPELSASPAVMFVAETAWMPASLQTAWARARRTLQRRGVRTLQGLGWLPGAMPGPTDALPVLLACLAPAVTVEPALVRSLIQRLGLPGGVALEHALWTHPALDGGLPYRQWYAHQKRQFLEVLRQQPCNVRLTCWQVIAEQHAHCCQVQRDQEVLSWADVVDENLRSQGLGPSAHQDALARYARVAQHLLHLSQGDPTPALREARRSSPGVVRAAAHQRLQHLPASLLEHAQLHDMLAKAALGEGSRYRTSTPYLDEFHFMRLRQVGQQLVLQSGSAGANGSSGEQGVALDDVEVAGPWLTVESAGRRQTLNLPATPEPLVIAQWADDLALPMTLRSRGGQVSIRALDRPPWAIEWGRDHQGLYALAPCPWGSPVRVTAPFSLTQDETRTLAVPSKPTPGAIWSLELDQFGLEAGLIVADDVTQFFRYLPPGRFLMGSPPDEDDRMRDEGPQHWVTLTRGLWLADTACTQGLWQAVMGDNPSHFKGDPDLPVENVSWDDVQSFLQKLQAYLPAGVEASLPTEAEWEYACRAGSTSAFSFGDTITTNQVNYDGNFPYRNAPKGEYRRQTVPVKALPANAWGLYQMHGNVWEWCADRQRPYTADAVSDPKGPKGKEKEARFAVRGGSWRIYARFARSARRDSDERGRRLSILGFRFALRSQAQDQGGGAPDWWVQRTQALRAADDAPGRGGTPRPPTKKQAPKGRK